MSQFIQLLAKTVVGQVGTFSQATLRKITPYFSSYRPTVSFDELTENKNCADTHPRMSDRATGRILVHLFYIHKDPIP